MKQSISSDTLLNFNKAILDKITDIEKDIMALKLTVIKKFSPAGGKALKLKGVLQGVSITDEDIAFVKDSLYSKTEI